MNRVEIAGVITERGALRFTPAGLPALDMHIEHESSVEEAGHVRQVRLSLKAVALGALAERLDRHGAGSRWRFAGFLASPRQSRQVVFHIQDFQQDQFQGGS
ncbi:MAG: primosomal replication protein N [Comamonadaceae bacterium]|nr:primosomal replication protein N [Comamonadaceae bacterium]